MEPTAIRKSPIKKVAFVSLGCDKNRVDSEYMLGLLVGSGYEIVQDTDSADCVVVNTCAFLEASRAEAIDTILRLADSKREGQKLVVAGCLPEKYVRELKSSLPEVDGYLGVEAREKLLELFQTLEAEERSDSGEFSMDLVDHSVLPTEKFSGHGRLLTTPENYAYLKIADGCDNRCTYCLIPSIRGKYRSVPAEDLLAEAAALAEGGVKELILVAQDLTRYGKDLYGETKLTELVRGLSKLDLVWIRLLYCYPEAVSEDLIAEIRDNPKLAKYIDIPLQHVSDSVLKRMGRRSKRSEIESLIRKLRHEIPGITIRSTFIVGFPGETEAEFTELLDFLREYRLDHAGFFAYSDEEDAPSYRIPGKISEQVKEERLLKALALSERLQAERLDGMIGKTIRVVCDGADFDEGWFVGRYEGQAPDVDTRILLEGDCGIESGTFYTVRITGRHKEDLIGQII